MAVSEQEEFRNISRVHRSKIEAKKTYDRISVVYDCLGGVFERRIAEQALGYLMVKSGEKLLEIGFGTGHRLKTIAQLVGDTGKAYGIDISEGMIQVTKKRLGKSGLMDRVELHQGDASKLPFAGESFDAAFMSFTLELFDTPEIPAVLNEVRRVLKPGGRLGITSLSKARGSSITLRIYEWIHKKWPQYVDCRPIYLEHFLHKTGYAIQRKETASLFLLPVEIVIATR